MNDQCQEFRSALAAFRQSIERLINGMAQIVEVQSTHTKLLRMILDAATANVESEPELSETLVQLLLAIEGQTKTLAQICSALTKGV